MLPLCPRCGQSKEVYRSAQAEGPVKLYYDETGERSEVFYDYLRFNGSNVIHCDHCGKIRHDLAVDRIEDKIIMVKDGQQT